MSLSPYIARIRERVGHELLLLPSVTVLPWDEEGRVLLVRHADGGLWGNIGGTIEIGESPADAAVREAREEAGVDVRVEKLAAALGGPEFKVTYSNGDQCAYVVVVFDARVVAGSPHPDQEETVEVAWVAPSDVPTVDLSPFARASFAALGLL